MAQRVAFYSGIGLVSAILLALQILQSRIFSVTTWYHLSFLVVSIAMFGLTLGALKVYRMDEAEVRENWSTVAGRYSLYLAVTMVISLAVQLYVPLVHENILKTFALLPIVAFFSGLPAYMGGVLVSLSLTRAPFPMERAYGADLFGAAAGCLAVLMLMSLIDAPSCVILLAALSLVAGRLYLMADSESSEDSAKLSRWLTWPLIPLLLLVAFNALAPSKLFAITWVKAKYEPESAYDVVTWNPISRVTVTPERVGVPFFWGPATKNRTEAVVAHRWLAIDGGAGTPLTKFDGKSFETLKYLEDDVTNTAHLFSKDKEVGVIGVGGGRDVLSAYYFGAKAVTAIDINPAQVRFLTKDPFFLSYTNLYPRPGLEIINDEARSWFARSDRKFDLIQMSLIDTWAASAAGAFALSENTLYTQEAWTAFLDDLKDDGILTVSRWYKKGSDLDSARLISLAMTTLWNQGVSNPKEHIVMVASEGVANIMVGKAPFSEDQIKQIAQHSHDKGFHLLLSPLGGEEQGVMRIIYEAESPQKQAAYIDTLPYDLAAPTDWRPFFFNQTKFDQPMLLLRAAFRMPGTVGTSFGHVRATMNLLFINFFSLLVVGLVIVYPQLSKVREVEKSTLYSGSLYFLLIGLGFMLIEIGLLQVFGIFLGHPTYSLSVTLFSLILFTGAGSLLSERFPLRNSSTTFAWAAATAAYGACLPFLIDYGMQNMIETSLLLRAGLCCVMLLPMGLLLGYGFPTGMALSSRVNTQLTPWLWGVNGAAGVLGSSVAIVLNIAFGVQYTIWIGCLCYALIPLAARVLLKKAASASESS